MSINEKFVETQFFKRVKRNRIGAVLSLDQLNVAGKREEKRDPVRVPLSDTLASITLFKKISGTPKPPLLSLLPLIVLLFVCAPAMVQELGVRLLLAQ